MLDQTAAATDHADTASNAPSVAIIGMAGRFPHARDLGEYWNNLISGRDCIGHFTIDELEAEGLDPAMVSNPKYIRSKGVLEDALAFDAGLFGYSPNEAELIDPQQRIFLETSLSALENAGCNPDTFEGCIGIYAGQSMSTYLLAVLSNPRVQTGSFMMYMTNDKDFLCSKVAYKLNLRGPCVVVASACSTSLLAVSMAYQSLIDYQCDVALAGGVCVSVPIKEGQLWEEGGNNSADGYLRAFDAKASGLVGGNGAGVVVLKRLEDAIADRDHIHAVIRSCAVNNDGSLKLGYTAPSVEGQAEAVALAQALGDIDPATISYVEAHGTGTRIGDPIEIAGLTKAFRAKTAKTGYCGIGSVKSNIGHLDAAAGVAGLLKTVLALQHREIPPTINYEVCNPEIDLANSPFYVCDKLTPWITDLLPRRAGVSAFAIGGTNVHVVVEEAPPAEPGEIPVRDLAVLTLSANSAASLKRAATNMAAFLRGHPETDLADAAYSLQLGRKSWKQRLAIVCRTGAEAATLLDGQSGQGAFRGQAEAAARLVFLFPGQGAQYIGMMRGLYDEEPTFRETLDECADLLAPEIGVDLRDLLFAGPDDGAAATALEQTRLTQPALFAVEYALARLWMSWGVRPAAMLGHSIGEYVAACIAGVMALPDALNVVAARGALMQSLPPGGMASIPLPDHELTPLLTDGLSLAAVLSAKLCVVAGNSGELDVLKARLAEYGVDSQRIRTSHAFHSKEMEPILPAFVAAFAGITLHAPKIPFISNVTGTWITDADAVDPAYWAKQLRNMVRIRDGLIELTHPPGTVCLEVGPGRSLSALSQQAAEGCRISVIASGRSINDPIDDVTTLIGAVAKLWVAGVTPDWRAVSGDAARRKIPLPTYSFEREEYSLLPNALGQRPDPEEAKRRGNPADLLYAPTWRRSAWPRPSDEQPNATWLVFLDRHGLGARYASRLKEMGRTVVTVALDTGGDGPASAQDGNADHQVAAENPDDFKRLLDTLIADGRRPSRILHLWNVGAATPALSPAARLQSCRTLGFDSLLHLVQAIGLKDDASEACSLTIVSTGLADVTGDETIEAEKAMLLGPCRVIPAEYPHIACKSIDLTSVDLADLTVQLVDRLLTEAVQNGTPQVAFRGGHRWTRSYEAMYFNPHGDPPPPLPSRLRERGTYLITGGLGGIGLAIAVHLATKVGARLVLTGRTLPPAVRKPGEIHPVEDAVARIEAAGGDVMLAKADVADRDAMAAIVAQAVERFGPIHGVIHAAGVAGRGIMQLKTKADVDRVLAPKVEGLLVLHELFAGADLDFLVACSSIATVVGTAGQAEYTSANAFLDAFVSENRHSDTRFLSINFDRWATTGMAFNELVNQPGQQDSGLDPAEGVEAFELALDSAEPQIAIALGPFEWISRYGPPRAEPQAGAPQTAQRSYNRPELDTVFEAPRNDLETGVAALFHEVLGIKDIGIDDNFFDLGGHSLLGVQLVNRMQQTFAVTIGVGELFNLPSVRSLSTVIVERRAQGAP